MNNVISNVTEKENLIKMNIQLLADKGTDTGADVDNGADKGTDTGTDEDNKEIEKTFTQAELDAIVAQRIARETKKIEAAKAKELDSRIKLELEEAAKLEQMSEAEKVKAKAEKEAAKFALERAKFDEEMKAFNQEKMLNITMKNLNEKGLPVEFASFIKANNADEVMENIANFEKGFKDAVEKAVVDRLKGNVPKTSTTTTQGVTKEQFNKMNIIQRNDLLKSNPTLFIELNK